MRRDTPALAILAFSVLFAAPRTHAGSLWDLIRSHRDLEVITVTDVSSYGAFMPRATPAEPQYYVALSLGYRDLGASVAGFTEPPAPVVLHLISAELAKQGYLPSTPRSTAPSLLLVYTWGTLNADRLYGPDPDTPPTQLNRAQIVRFLGGPKVGLDDDFFNPLTAPVAGLTANHLNARNILEVASEDFYVIVVAAYDLESALEKKHRPALWTTRISAPSLGFSLGDVLPAMLAIGGRQFGQETARPVWINASDEFKPDVRMGEIELLEYLGKDPLPVRDVDDSELDLPYRRKK